MRILLRDLAPGQDYAVQFQSSNIEGETSPWGPVYRFRTAGDVVAPQAPAGLTWAATGSSFLGTWNAVTLDGNGQELRDLKDYEVTISNGVISRKFYPISTYFELTLLQNQQIFGTIAPVNVVPVRHSVLSELEVVSTVTSQTESNLVSVSSGVI